MKSIIRLATLLFAMLAGFAVNAQNQNIQFRAKMSFPGQHIANVSGYADNGREYALLGASEGLIIVDVTNPDMPVQITQVPGPDNQWKEIKTYSHYAYTTSEGGGGINIVDMSNLPAANVAFQNYLGDSILTGALGTIHALHIDETKGFLYAYGSSNFQGGALVFDLNQDPYNPKYVGKFDQLGYIHDGYVDNDTMYACHIFGGVFSVVDMTDKGNPVLLATQNTPNSFPHNTWLSDDRKTLFTTDEVPDSYLASYDVSNLDDITLLDKVQSNPGSGSVVHNTHVLGDYAVTSWYRDGVTIVDATKPGNMVEVGSYDTYPQDSGVGFDGCWGVYPYLPSGTLIVSTRLPGEMYLLSPNYTRASYLEGNIREALTSNPIAGAQVEIVGNLSALKLSVATGAYTIGQALPGTVMVKASKLGYISQTLSADIFNGQTTQLDFELEKSPTYTLSGLVKDADTGNPVANAEVAIITTGASYSVNTDGNGTFTVSDVFAGTYEIIAGKWGYQYGVLSNQDIPGNQQYTLSLEKGYQDDFVLDYGWTASGTSATGIWERAEPLGIDVGIEISPEHDVPNDLGDKCFITGNGSDQVAVDDVESGTSILLSPSMDLTGYLNPKITAQFFCASFNQNQMSVDSIKFYISNGVEEKLVLATKGDMITWRNLSFDVTDFVSLSSDVRLRVHCYDPPNVPIFDSYEAAFDNFKVTDQALSSQEPTYLVQLVAQPNPFNNSTQIRFEGAEQGGQLKVFDVLGNLVETQRIPVGQVQATVAQDLPNGVYYVRLELGSSAPKSIKVMKLR